MKSSIEEGTSSHRTSCSRKREGNGSFSQPPVVSSRFSFAALNSDLALKKMHSELFRLKFETTTSLAIDYIILPTSENQTIPQDTIIKTGFESVYIDRYCLSRKKCCVQQFKQTSLAEDRSWEGFSLPDLFCDSYCCPCSACPLIQDIPDCHVGFTKSVSPQHRRKAIFILLWLICPADLSVSL